jgi:hypothetical protein
MGIRCRKVGAPTPQLLRKDLIPLDLRRDSDAKALKNIILKDLSSLQPPLIRLILYFGINALLTVSSVRIAAMD